jgi:hypothetical protein
MNPIFIDEFIKELNANISNNYQTVEYAFENEYQWPEVDPVRNEICKCILCGFNQAAITLTNHLMESALKKALITYESRENKIEQHDITNIFDDATKKYANKNLEFTIKQAYNNGLITNEEKEILDKYRKQYRNAFSHADPQKTFAGISTPVIVFTTNDLNENDEFFKRVFEDKPNTHLYAENTIIIQGIIQSIIAGNEAIPYFLALDGIVRNLCTKLFKTRMNRT